MVTPDRVQPVREWVEPPGPAAAGEPGELKVTVRPPTRGPTTACPYCSAQIPRDAWACMFCKRGVLGGRPVAVVMAVAGAVLFAVFFFGFWLPGFLKVQEQHREFDQRWGESRPGPEHFRQQHFPGR